MRLRPMSDHERLMLSAELTDEEGPIRAKLLADPVLAPQAAVLDEVHHDLLTMTERAGTVEELVNILTEELGDLNRTHDRKARGIYLALEAAELLSPEEDRGRAIAKCRKRLFPEGRGIVQRTYREQAGIAKRVKAHMDDDMRQLLGEFVFGGQPLLEVVDRWLETAITIGRRQGERARLRSNERDDAVTPAAIREARNRWIRAVENLHRSFEFCGLDDEDKTLILANIREAADKAYKRANASNGASDEEAPEVDLADEGDAIEAPTDSEPVDDEPTDSEPTDSEPAGDLEEPQPVDQDDPLPTDVV